MPEILSYIGSHIFTVGSSDLALVLASGLWLPPPLPQDSHSLVYGYLSGSVG